MFIKYYLLAELALVGAFAVMLLGGMFDDVLLAQDSQTTDLAVVFPNSKRVLRIMEHRTMESIVERMGELDVTAPTI